MKLLFDFSMYLDGVLERLLRKSHNILLSVEFVAGPNASRMRLHLTILTILLLLSDAGLRARNLLRVSSGRRAEAAVARFGVPSNVDRRRAKWAEGRDATLFNGLCPTGCEPLAAARSPPENPSSTPCTSSSTTASSLASASVPSKLSLEFQKTCITRICNCFVLL